MGYVSQSNMRLMSWLNGALREYNDKFGCSRVLYDIEDAPDGIEISEAGGVYEHNLGGVNYIGIAVTPFER